MSDRKVRILERKDPTGAPRLRELQRTGQLTEEKILLMAFCGHPGACLLMQEEIEKDTGVLIGWSNASWVKKGQDPKWSSQFRDHMQNWAKALMRLGPGRTTPAKCEGPGGALGTAIRESTGSHPKMCVCGGLGRVDHEIGGIWLGVLALSAAAKAALPLLREQRRGWSDDNSILMEDSISRAERWLKNPRERNEPKDNPCGGDWGDVTEAWGGLAPLIWERHGNEAHSLGRSMREFVGEFSEDPIRDAVEKRLIAWALEGAL